MAQQDYSGLITIGVLGALGWYAYEQGWFSNLFPATATTTGGSAGTAASGPSISTSILNAAQQASFIAAARSMGLTDAQIQVKLNETGTQYQACVAPGTWDNNAGDCMGGSVQTLPPTSTSTPTQLVPVVADPVATSNLVALLLSASGGASRLTIDGWAYYYNALPGKVPITADQMSAMIAANGQITDANRSTYNITPDAFVALLNGQGLSGLGFYAGIPVGAIHGGGW